MERQWIFLSNTFEVQTRGTVKKMYLLAADHRAKLQSQNADPDINLIYTEFDPIYQSFVLSRTLWRIASGTYKGKTQGFEEAMQELTEVKVPRWEGKVFAEYPANTPVATEIFPQKRSAFYDGTYEDRVDAVVALGEKLKEYAVLSATQLEVEAYGLQLKGLRDLQQNKEGVADVLSTQLEQQRIIVATAMYGNLGRLMYKYRTERERIEDYFELQYLREGGSEPELFEGDIDAGKIFNLNNLDGSDLNVTPATVVRMKNTSSTPAALVFYTANGPAEFPGAGPQFTLNPGQSLEKTVAELGFGTYNFFNIYNPGGNIGSWEIQVFA